MKDKVAYSRTYSNGGGRGCGYHGPADMVGVESNISVMFLRADFYASGGFLSAVSYSKRRRIYRGPEHIRAVEVFLMRTLFCGIR